VSALANVLEAEGLSTVAISLVRGQAVSGRAPRMLHCEFPLGRPLGRPGDASFQDRVLAAAFALLSRNDVPVLVDFPERIDDEADGPLACTLPPHHDPSRHPAVAEALGLRAAYERTFAATGRTNVRRSGGVEHVADLVMAFVRLGGGAALDDIGIEPKALGGAALDIRGYYEEAALSLVDHVPAARQAESWFYRQTLAGTALRRAQAALAAAGVSRGIWFSFVPTGQPVADPT
jgi:hypothetical protein